ncbi:MAG: VOC family protein [Sphingomonadales bacterium]|nr:VOC family protein [Sphingomonadales bacterium]
MGLRGVNRVMIAVHDLATAKRQYAELLGATFIDADWTGEPFGINVAIAWDAGIELCAPMPGREADSAVSQFLAHRGEGVMNVFFGVDDGDAANRQASALGYGCVNALDYTQAEIDQHLGGLFSRYQEFTLDSAKRCGFAITLARIDEKPRL